MQTKQRRLKPFWTAPFGAMLALAFAPLATVLMLFGFDGSVEASEIPAYSPDLASVGRYLGSDQATSEENRLV